jgi:hypothetical protein
LQTLKTAGQWLSQDGRRVLECERHRPAKRIARKELTESQLKYKYKEQQRLKRESFAAEGSDSGGGGGGGGGVTNRSGPSSMSATSSAASTKKHFYGQRDEMFDFRPGGVSTNDAVIVSKSIDTAVVKVTRQEPFPYQQTLGDVKRGEFKEKNDIDDDDVGDDDDGNLYKAFGAWQTIVAEPVSLNADGSLPVNAYGCFELFHSSLLPLGAVHVDHKKAKQAVNQLKLERGKQWAECLIGFENQLPVLQGVVVNGLEQGRRVKELAEQLGKDDQEVKDEKKKRKILDQWARLVHGVMVQERVKREYGRGEERGGGGGKGGGRGGI